MNEEIRNKIQSIGETVSALTGKFYYAKSPEGVSKPYGVHEFVVSTNSRDSGSRFKTIPFQINVYSLNALEMDQLVKALEDVYEDAESSFNTTSYVCDRIDFDFARPMPKENKTYQTVLQFTLQLTHK